MNVVLMQPITYHIYPPEKNCCLGPTGTDVDVSEKLLK